MALAVLAASNFQVLILKMLFLYLHDLQHLYF